MPLRNIRNKLRKSPGPEILKNITGSDVVTETRSSKTGNYYGLKIPISIGCSKCYLCKDTMNKISQFPQFIGVAINFVIFHPVLWAKLALDHVNFLQPNVCQFHIYGPLHTRSQSVSLQKWQLCQITLSVFHQTSLPWVQCVRKKRNC